MIAILGAGKLTEAIIRGSLSAGTLLANQILVAVRSPERKASLALRGWRNLTRPSEVRGASMVILGVRHSDMPGLLDEYGPELEGMLVVSLALGVSLQQLEHRLTSARVMRVVPNIAVRVRESMTLVCKGTKATAADCEQVRSLFSPLGTVLELPESQLDTANAVSGAGPAYVFTFVQSMVRAAEAAGLSTPVAEECVRQTVFGAARLLNTNGSPQSLLSEVVAPGGSTQAGLEVLARANFDTLLKDTIEAARARAEARTAESDQAFGLRRP